MKKAVVIITILLLLSACGGTPAVNMPTDETYLPGTDFQFFNNSHVQNTDKGCYFIHGTFLYFLDREKGSIYPVCNKPNCLHDRETDEDKLKDCNAYFPFFPQTERLASLMLYQDQIFVVYSFSGTYSQADEDFNGILYPSLVYRIAADGSAKDRVFVADKIESPIIHRGYLYFWSTGHTINVDKDKDEKDNVSISTSSKVFRINAASDFSKGEVVFAPEGNINRSAVRDLYAAGNYLYFTYYPNSEQEKGHLVIYDIHKKTIEDTEDSKMYEHVFLNTWFYGRKRIENDEAYEGIEMEIIRGNLNTSQTEPFTTLTYDHAWRSGVGSDGKYLYVDNFPDTLFTEGTKVHFRVYDESGTLFDDYTFPDEIEKYKQELELARPAPGGSDYQYFPFSDAETGKWGIHIFDKKQLGSLKGKEFEFTTVYGE